MCHRVPRVFLMLPNRIALISVLTNLWFILLVNLNGNSNMSSASSSHMSIEFETQCLSQWTERSNYDIRKFWYKPFFITLDLINSLRPACMLCYFTGHLLQCPTMPIFIVSQGLVSVQNSEGIDRCRSTGIPHQSHINDLTFLQT